ncbi:cilia- and flagella-associated protein 65-like [Patiria miniata]|uniref:Cilia- and flagella-associated protein 65 n=1 Tax=Patiria miniata TaxID=46514 RepID=A0A913ZAX7_PATMI|nr:cilia- and flagella-associated protein 65-like [Patiria miniata]
MSVAVTSRHHHSGSNHSGSALPRDGYRNKSKVKHYGIEVVKGVTWKGWEPGGEYTKNVILKNVQVKTQKLKYSSPSTRFFSTLYPEPIVLSAGTSFSLPITFRPLEKNLYVDKIEFQTNDGVFDVPIQAVLPQHDLSLPKHLDFGMCASMHNIQRTFELSNTSELATRFAWLTSSPFVLEPSEGTLAPKSRCTILATFKPTSALVYETVAECRYGDDLSHKKTLPLEGIGKYPHLLVSSPGKIPKAMDNLNMESVIAFGDVPIGATVEKSLQVHNLSPVDVPFTVEHPTSSTCIDTVFYCSQASGIASPQSQLQIPVRFQPQNVNEESVDYLHIHAIGKVSKTVVKLVGKCTGPQVSLGSKVLSYGLINTGQSGTGTIDIINQSGVEAVFQFMIDSTESAFKFGVHCGKIAGNTTQTIIVVFKPTHPINYYRRVTCVVQNQDPLFLDLIGTCHTELVKPAVLQPQHLSRYRIHQARGFSVFPPEQLNEILKEGKLQLDDNGCLIHQQAESVETYLNPEALEPPMAEYFNDGYYGSTNKCLHVGMDTIQVDFGQCLNLSHIESKTLNVTNHTKGKMTVTWMTDDTNVFCVTPVSCDIPPLKMTSFRVAFKPGAPNQFFAAELEGYAFYKSMRDYRLVQDETFCPPWCLTVSAIGHTFQPNNQTFLPKLSLDTNKVVFPAVDSGDSIYKTILITNDGSTPIQYAVPEDPTGTFQVKPSKGLLTDKYQLLVIKNTPQQENVKLRHQLQCCFNDDSKHNRTIELLGSSEQPNVLLDSEGVLFFKPTCIGTASQHSYKIRNISRLPLKFTWKCRQEDRSLVQVEPETGTILPNEIQAHVWTFTPREDRKYVLKPYAHVEDIRHEGDIKRRKQFNLRVVGEGSTGEIKAEDSSIDLSDIVVGTAVSQDLVIFNNSNCSLHYQLLVDQELHGSYADQASQQDGLALELDDCKGILPARSRRIIHATFRPVRRLSYTFHICYQLMSPTDCPLSQDKQKLCTVSAVGVYPNLKVTDARCYGSASGISKARLWSLFSLDSLNTCLESDPSPEELTYTTVTCRSTTRKPTVNTRAIMDFNFSSAPQDSQPCIVHLMLENTGTVPTEWSFSFPTDLQLELEYWAETGDYDADELHEMRIMDNKLFCVEPRCGKLGPGQCQTITFAYKHSFPGTDRLPVLFKLTRGREILLNFVGVTVDLDSKYVHFPSNKHMFAPVPVGVASHPKQVYELYNGGAVPVMYQLDLTALDYVLQENFNHKIFECLNPNGEIAPGRTANIEWVFSPLEAKTYMVDVPIHIIGGDTALITFTGVGYDKRIMGETMPLTDGTEISNVPATQSIPMPGQLLYLSQERVAFSNVPLFCQAHRMIEMVNRSASHSLSFEWYVTSEADSKVIDIQPVTGALQPSQNCTCKVTFTAIGEPSFYDLDIVCEVTDETEMAKFHQKLESWKKEKERQKYEFTITDKDMIKETKSSSKLCRTLSSKRSDSPDFQHYQTLPPIRKVQSSKELDEAERLQGLTASGTPIWDKPAPPDKFLLHLGATARTHTIAEFQSNFPNEVQNFFIDRTMSERFNLSSQEVERMPEVTTSLQATEEERELVCGVSANIIRALLDDHDFHEALKDISDEPIPYFMQFGDRPQTLGHQSTEAPLTDPHKPLTPPDVFLPSDSRPSSGKSEPLAETVDIKTIEATAVTPNGMDLIAVRSQTQSSGALHTEADYQQSLREEQKRMEQQTLKRLPEFATLLESVLENSLFNIITEASHGEINLTARPRLIALPPSSTPQVGPDQHAAVPSVRIGSTKRTSSASQSTQCESEKSLVGDRACSLSAVSR